jgi:tetratricopeptide (TPR) repeat protein
VYSDFSRLREKEAHIELAIACYKEALKVRTFEKFPLQYASTQNNLGTAYWMLAELRNKEADLGMAIGCYRAALKIYAKERLPWYFVETSWNLAVALRMKGDIAEALKVLEGLLPTAEGLRHPGLQMFKDSYEQMTFNL